MQAPKTLLSQIGEITGAAKGFNRLVIVMRQLSDFDSMEYAQALVPRLQEIELAGITVQVIAIGNESGAERFCRFTGFPR